MIKVIGTDRRSLKGAACKSALKADATRYLRRIADQDIRVWGSEAWVRHFG